MLKQIGDFMSSTETLIYYGRRSGRSSNIAWGISLLEARFFCLLIATRGEAFFAYSFGEVPLVYGLKSIMMYFSSSG
jgi:hypothetical protein